MRPRTEYLLIATHAGGALLLTMLAVALGFTALAPWQQRAAARPLLRKSLEETSERCARLIQVNQDDAETLQTALRAADREESRCNLTDSQLMAMVNTHCASAGVSLEALEPSPPTRDAAHRDLQIRGRGRFTALHRALAALEAESPYLRVTGLRVEGPPNLTLSADQICTLSWTLRWVPAGAAPKPAGGKS